MKQIFNWLREQIEAKAFRQGFSNDVLVKVEDVGNVIDEAEAKWESDCCEYENMGSFYKPSCNDNMNEFISWVDLRHYKFCPYCGKPIKILEV